MATVAIEAVSYVLQCCGAACQSVARLLELFKAAGRVITKVVTCGQGWRGIFHNFLTLINSEEDPDFKDFHLPEAENRRPTDIAFLVLFSTVLVGMIVAMNRAIAYGRPEVHYQGLDTWGNVCGYKNNFIPNNPFSGRDMTKFDKLLIFDFLSQTSALTSGDPHAMAKITSTTRLCVASCPMITGTFNCWEFLEAKGPYAKSIAELLCRSADKELSQTKKETLTFVETNSRCVPNVVSKSISVEKQNKMLNLYSQNWIHNIIMDCKTCAAELTWVTLIATGFTILFICVVQNSADSICWFSFSSFCFVGILASCSLWYMYSEISAEDTATVLYSDANVMSRAGDTAASTVPQAGYSIVFRDAAILASGATVFFTTVCCLVGKENMEISAILFKTAVEAMNKVRWIYILPLLSICSISFSAGLFLYTINLLTAVFKDNIEIRTDPEYGFPTAKMEEDTIYTNWALLFEFLAFAWLFCFIISCQSLIASSAIASWYFIKDKDDLDRPMRIASTRLVRCHLGSAAAGGILVGFLGWIRAPFSFLQSRLNRALVKARDRSNSLTYSKLPYTVSQDYELGKPAAMQSSRKPAPSRGPKNPPFNSKNSSRHSSLGSRDGQSVHHERNYIAGSQSNRSNYGRANQVEYLETFAWLCSPNFWLLNNLLVYISDLNFGIVALKGIAFLRAGNEVRTKMLEDPKLKGLMAISSYSIFLGKMSVVVIVLPFGALFLRYKEGVFVYGYPLAMSAGVSFVIAHVCLSLFNAAVGSIFMCLTADRALNDGSEEAPFFGKEELIMKFHEILSPDESLYGPPEFRFADEFPRPEHKKKRHFVNASSDEDSDGDVESQSVSHSKKSKKSRYATKTFETDHSSMFLLMPKKNGQNKDTTGDRFSKEKEGKPSPEQRRAGKEKRKKDPEYASKSPLRNQTKRNKEFDDRTYETSRHHQRSRNVYEDRSIGRQSSDSGGMFGNLFNETQSFTNNIKQRNDDDDSDDDIDDEGGEGGGSEGGEKHRKKKKRDKDKDKKKDNRKDKNKSKDKKKVKDKKKNETKKDDKKNVKDKKKNESKKDDKKNVKDKKKNETKKDDKKTERKGDKNANKKGDKKMDKKGNKKTDKKGDKKTDKNADKKGKNDRRGKNEKQKVKDKKDKERSSTKKSDENTAKKSKTKKKNKTNPKRDKGKADEKKTKDASKKTRDEKENKSKTKPKKPSKPGKKGKPKSKTKGPKKNKTKTAKPGKKQPKMKKMKGPKKPKLKGFKKPKVGKMKGLKKPKMGKMKGFKKPKMGKLKTPKKPKMGKMKGFKKPKMGKMKGFKKPKLGKLKGLKKPKTGKMKGLKRGKLKGRKGMGQMGKGGGKGMGRGGRGMAKGAGKGGGKLKGLGKVGKAAGVAGAVVGGAEGAANIADGMLRIAGKKDEFNDKVNDVTFGTRKRAKATTVAQGIFSNPKGIKEALQDVDDQFDEMEREEEEEKKRQNLKEKREHNKMQNLLAKRLEARKRKK